MHCTGELKRQLHETALASLFVQIQTTEEAGYVFQRTVLRILKLSINLKRLARSSNRKLYRTKLVHCTNRTIVNK